LGRIRIGLLGVGNAASALVQSLHLAKERGEELEGVLHWDLGGYKVTDIEIVAAYDVDKRKIGKDLSEAIYSEPNNMTILVKKLPKLDVMVEKGVLLDKLGPLTSQVIKPVDTSQEEFINSLREKRIDMLVNLISGFAFESSRFYAEISAEHSISFVNCTPANVVNDEELAKKFDQKAIVVGDDLMSQFGSTRIHKAIIEWLRKNGAMINYSYDLDVGGNPETFGSLELRSRLVKSKVKEIGISAATRQEFPIAALSMDYVDFLRDNRDAIIYITAKFFAGAQLTMEIKMRAPDSLNAFNPLVDVIRAVRIGLDRGLTGVLKSVSALYFKNPPEKMTLEDAEKAFKEFIEGKRTS